MIGAAMAILAGTLPNRLWGRLEEHVPVRAMALPSALLPLSLALGLGLPGFLRYAKEVAAQNVDLALEMARRSPEVTTAMPVGLSIFNFFGFLLFTPLGLLTTYLAISGAVRAISVAMDEPHGDPVLSLLDQLLVRGARRTAEARAAAARARREGVEIADRILSGEEFGQPEADLVVIASRRKPGWEEGVTVITDDGWFKLGPPLDRTFPEGLRTIYPLIRASDLEVLRKSVRYDPPARD